MNKESNSMRETPKHVYRDMLEWTIGAVKQFNLIRFGRIDSRIPRDYTPPIILGCR